MGELTKIEWASHTFNPWLGCTKVSPACDHCYAEGWAKRTGHPELWDGERRRTTTANWLLPLKWDRAAARIYTGRTDNVRPRVFCASLADVFDNQVPPRWRNDLWHRIDQTPNLDWLLLTKRPQNIAKMLPDPRTGTRLWGGGWPNVWLGTTTENQEEYDRRWPHLRAIPAAVKFISYEPALGPLTLRRYGDGIPDWVICGGESGPGARPMHPDWARSIRDQCQAADVAFFFKQWGEHQPGGPEDTVRYVRGMLSPKWSEAHGHSFMRVGKKAAGRLLDGREWNEFPSLHRPLTFLPDSPAHGGQSGKTGPGVA